MKKLLLIKTIFCLLVFASCKSAVNNEEIIHASYDTNWYYMHDAGVDTYGWYNYYVDGDKKFGNFWERSGLPCQRRLGLVKGK